MPPTSKDVFVASRLPKRAGVSGWVATLPPRTSRPALNGSLTADVAIIGAGFAGLSAARRISRLDPSTRVAILEAGIVGEGPAGANSGFIIDLPHEVVVVALALVDVGHRAVENVLVLPLGHGSVPLCCRALA